MDVIQSLGLGLSVALTPYNLIYCFVGAALGTLIGVLPGLGPSATVAMLIPITFTLPSDSALIMLAGIYYGAQYGGSTTAILVNLPGEASSVVTAIDGYQMARQGRAGAALAISALGSFFAGTVATFAIALFAPPLASIALKFGPAEYFSLMVLGLVTAVVLANGSVIKAVAMVVLGLLLGLIGTDVNSGFQRFTFGVDFLMDGVNIVAIAMGIFGLGEIIANLGHGKDRSVYASKVSGLWLNRDDIKRTWKPVLRGTALGSILGILPGGGSILASFYAYTLEKKLSRTPARFGKGAIEGVAAPESANNAGAQTSFIPLLTLGIPSNPVMALMLGAMMIQGVIPGPQMISRWPELFWGVIASMWIGNIMLVVLNLPLIGIWVRLLSISYRFLFPAILLFCCIGVYSLNNNVMDIVVAVVFGLLGYLFFRLKCESAPLLLGFILGPGMEEYLRRALLLSDGDPTDFITRPISAGFLAVSLILLALILFPLVRGARQKVFQE